MPRMLDEFYKEIMTADTEEDAKWLRDNLVCVDITGPAGWFLRDCEQNTFHLRNDFPTILPPWPFAWFEYKPPKYMRRGTQLQRTPSWAQRVGFETMVFHVEDKNKSRALREDFLMRMSANAHGFEAPGYPERAKTLEAVADSGVECKWMVYYINYMRVSKRLRRLATMAAYLDRDGRYIENTNFYVPSEEVAETFKEVEDTPEVLGDMQEELSSMFMPLLYSISLLHCKNVELVPALESKTAKQYRRRNHTPSIRYKTLVVEPLRKQIRAERDGEQGGSTVQKALHIVRGHFKDFRSKGLFGKYHDIYWWDMHARGSTEAGVIHKNYQVNP